MLPGNAQAASQAALPSCDTVAHAAAATTVTTAYSGADLAEASNESDEIIQLEDAAAAAVADDATVGEPVTQGDADNSPAAAHDGMGTGMGTGMVGSPASEGAGTVSSSTRSPATSFGSMTSEQLLGTANRLLAARTADSTRPIVCASTITEDAAANGSTAAVNACNKDAADGAGIFGRGTGDAANNIANIAINIGSASSAALPEAREMDASGNPFDQFDFNSENSNSNVGHAANDGGADVDADCAVQSSDPAPSLGISQAFEAEVEATEAPNRRSSRGKGPSNQATYGQKKRLSVTPGLQRRGRRAQDDTPALTPVHAQGQEGTAAERSAEKPETEPVADGEVREGGRARRSSRRGKSTAIKAATTPASARSTRHTSTSTSTSTSTPPAGRVSESTTWARRSRRQEAVSTPTSEEQEQAQISPGSVIPNAETAKVASNGKIPRGTLPKDKRRKATTPKAGTPKVSTPKAATLKNATPKTLPMGRSGGSLRPPISTASNSSVTPTAATPTPTRALKRTSTTLDETAVEDPDADGAAEDAFESFDQGPAALQPRRGKRARVRTHPVASCLVAG